MFFINIQPIILDIIDKNKIILYFDNVICKFVLLLVILGIYTLIESPKNPINNPIYCMYDNFSLNIKYDNIAVMNGDMLYINATLDDVKYCNAINSKL